jgi:outer membrane biosynthesis protein TonB
MTSGDDKQEEEEFEDIPSEVDGDASDVGNTSAQEKIDKLNKVVKESSKDNNKKSKKEDKENEKEEKKKEDNKQDKNKEKRRRKRTPSPSSLSSSSSSSSENGDGDDEYYGLEFPREHSSPSPRTSSRVIIEVYPLTIIL